MIAVGDTRKCWDTDLTYLSIISWLVVWRLSRETIMFIVTVDMQEKWPYFLGFDPVVETKEG